MKRKVKKTIEATELKQTKQPKATDEATKRPIEPTIQGIEPTVEAIEPTGGGHSF